MQEHTNLCGAAKVNQSPVVLLWPAKDVAWLKISVGVPELVQLFQCTDGVAECLHRNECVREINAAGDFSSTSLY